MIKTLKSLAVMASLPVVLGGCLVGAAVNAAGEVVEAGVEVTGAVVGTTVDVIVPDGDDEKKDKKDKKDDE